MNQVKYKGVNLPAHPHKLHLTILVMSYTPFSKDFKNNNHNGNTIDAISCNAM